MSFAGIPTAFKERKAAESAAYLLMRAGGPLQILKLMKLLYLAERRSFELYGEPMIGDRLVSMPHGPVLSRTYNHMNGELWSEEGGWTTWIADREGYELTLRDSNKTIDDLLQLSDADLAILSEVWDRFGSMSGSALRQFTHRSCPEWRDPDGSMLPIATEDLLEALGYTEEQRREVLERLVASNAINAAFS